MLQVGTMSQHWAVIKSCIFIQISAAENLQSHNTLDAHFVLLMSKNKAVTTKPRTNGNEKLLFHCVGWKEGNEFVGTNSKGFQREHDPDPKQGLKQRWRSPTSGMESDSQGRWHMAVVALSREEHGMQWSRDLAHWVTLNHAGYDSVLPKSPVSTVSPVSHWETKCSAWRAVVLLLCSFLREASPGVALAKTTKRKEQGVGRGRETEGKLLILYTLYW